MAACALILGSMNSSASVDVTNTYLTDADLASLAGWGNPGKTDWKTDGAVNVVEFWNWSSQFSFTQTANLPVGYYRLAVNAFYRNSWGGDGTNNDMAWIFAGEKTQNVIALTAMSELSGYSGSSDLYRAATAFSQGYYSNEFDFHVTEAGNIELGFKGTCPNGGWCILGPVKLYEYGVSDYIADYNTKVTEAEALYSSYMPSTILSALQTAAGKKEADFETVDDVLEAVETLKTAIANANTAIASYASLLTAITNANNHTSYTPVFAASNTIYTNAITTAQGVYDAAEVTDCSAAITALTNGIQSAYENDYSVFANDYAYDYSTLLNQDMTQWASTDYVTMTANEHWNGLTGQTYYEQSGADWAASSWSHAASETATLPAGNYVMSITARASGGVTSTMSVKVGDNEAITVALPNKGSTGRGITTDGEGSFADGTYANTNGRGWEYRFIAFTVSEESPVTISLSSSTNVVNNWVSLAAPLLKGNVHPNQIKLNQAKSLASTLNGYDGLIPTAAFATFAADITAGNAATVESADLDDIITNLQADITTATEIRTSYNNATALISTATTLKNVANDNATANSTLNDAITTATNDLDDCVSTSEIETVVSTLKTAMITYVGAANPVGDGAKFDCTFMLTNPDLTGLPTWQAADGWASEETDGNSQVMVNGSKTSGDYSFFYEYWSETAKASGKFALYNAVTLPAGTFDMSCYAFAEDQNPVSTVDGVYFYANDTQGSCVTATKLTEQTLSFVNEIEQEVKIGLKTQTGNTRNWMGIGYVKLYKVPAVTVDINEAVDYTPESVAGQVTLTRTLSTTNWNTFVVPFQITNEELTTAFGAEVAVAEYSEAADGDNSTISFTTMETPAIAANKPVLLKPSTVSGTNEYVFENRTVATGDAKVAGTNFDFTGTYAASTDIAEGDYFIGSNKLWKSAGTTTIAGTRAYIKAKTAGARIANFFIDGEETTGIEGMSIKTVGNDRIYNLNGQQMKKALKGIYIQNGKKMVVK